jgi:hypothetical protein
MGFPQNCWKTGLFFGLAGAGRRSGTPSFSLIPVRLDKLAFTLLEFRIRTGTRRIGLSPRPVYIAEVTMRLDIGKIDERIQKLQELRRIAIDSEMAQLLSEFLVSENGFSNSTPAAATVAASEPLPQGDGVSEFVKGVLEGKDSSQRGALLPSWSSRKA